MYRKLLPTIASALIAIQAVSAQVPSLINYQGRLTDSGGAPVTGAKNFAISIFDAATAGNLLYAETVGAVTLDTNGVYSFQFGSAGTSNTQVTETVATTNGSSTTFQKVLDNSPVVAGSVSVADGTYTWSQSAGSSNGDDFGVAYSTSLRRVTVNYYTGAPAAGRSITATYRYGTGGITGALSSGAEHWMAISVDGTAQATRQRVLAVPFATQAMTANSALQAQSADFAQVAATSNTLQPQSRAWRPHPFLGNRYQGAPFDYFVLPISPSQTSDLAAFVPNSIKSINSVRIRGNFPHAPGELSVSIVKSTIDQSGNQIGETLWSNTTTSGIGTVDKNVTINLPLDENYNYRIHLSSPSSVLVIFTDILFSVTE